MKTSELIEMLQNVLATAGDLYVFRYTRDEREVVEDVFVQSTDDGPIVELI